jgi:pantetheine-phosphate adenylyltransferase
MREAVYAFSGDPITNGHLDIIERALGIFDRLIVAIGVHPTKKYTFSLEERENMTQLATSKYGDRVRVVSFQGLLVDFAYAQNVKYVVRGVRTNTDFEYENVMAEVNRTQRGIDTIPLFSKPTFEKISSSTVKELQANQGDIVEYVPLFVKQQLEKRISNQYILGITGEIGAGKTYVDEQIRKHFWQSMPFPFSKDSNVEIGVHSIELDEIARNLLKHDMRPFAISMRDELFKAFGDLIRVNPTSDVISSKKIGDYIFQNDRAREIYNNITRGPILYEMKQLMRNKQGFIFVNSALLVEAELLPVVNNNVLLVTSKIETRVNRLRSRGYTDQQIEERMSSQLDAEAKRKLILQAIEKDGHGKIIEYKNEESKFDESLCAQIVTEFSL